MLSPPPKNPPFQYSHLARIQPSNSFVDAILSSCRGQCGDAAEGLEVSTLRCDEQGGATTLHCDVLIGPCIREQTDHLEASTPEMRWTTGWHLPHCDVLVGPCTREQTDHLLVPLQRCDEQGGATTLHWDVLVGPCVREQKQDRLQLSVLRCNKGVAPPHIATSLSAPTSESRRTTSRCPPRDAMDKGVAPPCIAMSLSAPALKSRQTTSRCPL